jgi:hypothetical protein
MAGFELIIEVYPSIYDLVPTLATAMGTDILGIS